jgi:hypothetical protein
MRRGGKEDQEVYPQPSKFFPKYGLFTIILTIPPQIGLIYLVGTDPTTLADTTFRIFFIFLFALFGIYDIDLIHAKILRRQYVELTPTQLIYKNFFKEKTLLWQEIKSVRKVIGYKGMTYIEIFGRKPDDPDVTIKINEIKYPNISQEKLILTVKTMINLDSEI